MPNYTLRPPVPLTTAQVNQLTSITNNGTANFVAGYNYIYEQFKDNPNLDWNTEFWFSQAREINSGVGPAAQFIRGYTSIGLTESGQPVPNLSTVSDLIAQKVIQDIINRRGIPDLALMLEYDIQVAIEVANIQSIAGWGGSFYYWNLPRTVNGQLQYDSQGHVKTIGDEILASPAATDLFVNTLGKTLASFTRPSSITLLFDGDFYGAIKAILNLPPNIQDEAFAVARANSSTFTALWRFLFSVTPEDRANGAGVFAPIANTGRNLAAWENGGELSPDPEKRAAQLQALAEYLESLRAYASAQDDPLPPSYIAGAILEGAFRFDTSDFLNSVGSVLGKYIAGDNPVAQVVVSASLQTILTNLASFWRTPWACPEELPLAKGSPARWRRPWAAILWRRSKARQLGRSRLTSWASLSHL